MTDAQRCPGNELNKSLSTFDIQCACGSVKEIFSDELDKDHKCAACGENLDLSDKNPE